ncbi:nuclear transport factor 2 family protein [Fulvivirga sediminis]|uniref:Nuclear transport factor 2 family protein n=1 Tax=Fulvivirga sediminis TaxID=2803949 RepID=A0A937JYD6_9BACT|nr:nuclear transport factor 2 family protein [Fulvivirga sediminis]MBL3655569.1 nuclear transport factor 2 family protein [Fulvivirga sediminis]
MKKLLMAAFLCYSLSSLGQTHEDVNQFINKWHQAASDANAKVFFESMADHAIYIGTDSSERWNKEEFFSFAKPYFDQGKAWDFKPYDRDIHISSSGNIIWFSELLDTWMGICRGSGVLSKTKNNEWKIEQYHLSVTVPNELIDSFIKLIEEN